MRKNGEKLQVAESIATKTLDTVIIPASYYGAMKTKKQPSVFNLRLTKGQKESVRRAAKLEGRSMHNYILRTVLKTAAADLQSQTGEALNNLAS